MAPLLRLSANHHEQEQTMTTLDQRRTKRPGNRENIDRIKTEMHRDTQLYRLRASVHSAKNSG